MSTDQFWMPINICYVFVTNKEFFWPEITKYLYKTQQFNYLTISGCSYLPMNKLDKLLYLELKIPCFNFLGCIWFKHINSLKLQQFKVHKLVLMIRVCVLSKHTWNSMYILFLWRVLTYIITVLSTHRQQTGLPLCESN